MLKKRNENASLQCNSLSLRTISLQMANDMGMHTRRIQITFIKVYLRLLNIHLKDR